MRMSRLLHGPDFRDWCRGHGIHHRRAQLATDVTRQLGDDLSVSENVLRTDRDFNADDLTKALFTGLFDNLGANLEEKPARNPWYDSRLGQFRLLFQSAAYGVCPLVLAGSVRRSLPGNQVVDLAARIDPSWLYEVLPHLCVANVTDTRHEAWFNGILVFSKETAQPAPPSAPEPPSAAPPRRSLRPAAAATLSDLDWSDVNEGFEPPPDEWYEEPVTVSPSPVSPAPQAAPDNLDTSLDRLSQGLDRLGQGLDRELALILAKEVNKLTDKVERRMIGGINKVRALAVLRQYSNVPATPDSTWTDNARGALNYAQMLYAANKAPKTKKGSKTAS
jgi:hypothetical protein